LCAPSFQLASDVCGRGVALTVWTAPPFELLVIEIAIVPLVIATLWHEGYPLGAFVVVWDVGRSFLATGGCLVLVYVVFADPSFITVIGSFI
jgi:hypothetical protein